MQENEKKTVTTPNSALAEFFPSMSKPGLRLKKGEELFKL